MYRKKRRGPSTEPCGMPVMKLHWVFLSTLLVIRNKWWQTEVITTLIHSSSRTDRKICLFSVSKAAVRSVPQLRTRPAVLGDWSTSVVGCFCERAVLNHDWFGLLRLCTWFSKCTHINLVQKTEPAVCYVISLKIFTCKDFDNSNNWRS